MSFAVEEIQRISERKKEVVDVKISSDGQFLAVGSKEKVIDIYARGQESKFARIAILKGHSVSYFFFV